MEADFFKRSLTEAGIQVAIPHADEVDCIIERVHDKLERDIIKSQVWDTFTAIIEWMYQDEDIEAAILGCTEPPPLFVGTALPVRVLDTVDIHIEMLFKILQ